MSTDNIAHYGNSSWWDGTFTTLCGRRQHLRASTGAQIEVRIDGRAISYRFPEFGCGLNRQKLRLDSGGHVAIKLGGGDPGGF
jgi:hypothetical protein